MADKQLNLKRGWVKGQSGNPAGRPKKEVCITSWLKEYANHKISLPIDLKDLTYAQAAALKAWQASAKGELSYYNFIIERIEGKLPNAIDVTSKGNELKQSPIYQFVSLETKAEIEALERTNGLPEVAVHRDIPQELRSLPDGQAGNQ